MAREKGIEAKVGALILVCLVILVTFFLLLGNVTFGESEFIEVDWPTSAGLRQGAPVKVVGMKAGRVESVTYLGGKMDEAVGRRVYIRVKLSIKPELRETLRADSKFYLTTLGMLGEKYIEIDPGSAEEPLAAGAIPLGIPPMRIEVMAANLNATLSTATRILAENEHRIGQTLTDISKAAATGREALDEGRALVKEVRKTLTTIEARALRIMDSSERAIVEFTPGRGEAGNDLKKILEHGAHIAESLDNAIGDGREIKGVLKDARALTANARVVIDRVGGKAVKVADSAMKVADRAVEMADRVDHLMGTAEGMMQDSKGGILDVIGKTRSLLAIGRELAVKLRDGKGTLGALLNDREMFDDARELMKNLKRHPWKFLWKE